MEEREHAALTAAGAEEYTGAQTCAPDGGECPAQEADTAEGAVARTGPREADTGAREADSAPALTAGLLAGLLAARGGQQGQNAPVQDEMRRELEGYRQREQARFFSDDLAAIRTAYPEESAASVEELGPQYLAICAAGVDPLCAYEAVRSHRARTAPPPSTGDFGGKAPAKEFYTRDEVARMSRGEIRRNFDKIRRSMSHWNF